MVDDGDAAAVLKYKWSATECSRGRFYAHRKVDRRSVYLHRFIMRPGPGLEVDHIDGNTLNNSRSNLRVCTHAENAKNIKRKKNNSSGYTGVSWCKNYGKWEAYIWLGKKVGLGYFDNPRDAALAFDVAAKKHRGEFAKLNLPEKK